MKVKIQIIPCCTINRIENLLALKLFVSELHIFFKKHEGGQPCGQSDGMEFAIIIARVIERYLVL